MVAYTTGPPYRHFTASEIDAANDTDLPDLLASLGYQVRRVGSYYTTKEMDSLRIKNRRTWFRYSENRGGDAISFLERFEGKSFPEAVEYLLDFVGAKSAHSVSACGENCVRSLAPPLPMNPLRWDSMGTPAGARFLRAPPPVPEKKAVPLCPPAAEQRQPPRDRLSSEAVHRAPGHPGLHQRGAAV